MTLDARLVVATLVTLTNPQDLAAGRFPLEFTRTLDLENGVGANQADRLFSDKRTLAASATEDLDLAGGALLDPFGATFSPARLKAVVIVADSDNVNAVVVGGDVNAVPIFGAAANTISLAPGDVFAKYVPGATGIPITAGTGDILQVANGGAGSAVDYEIVLIGASA